MATVDGDSLVLSYADPAADWAECLPVGNGRLGAMVYGRSWSEQIGLNEDTFWSGPGDRAVPSRPGPARGAAAGTGRPVRRGRCGAEGHPGSRRGGLPADRRSAPRVPDRAGRCRADASLAGPAGRRRRRAAAGPWRPPVPGGAGQCRPPGRRRASGSARPGRVGPRTELDVAATARGDAAARCRRAGVAARGSPPRPAVDAPRRIPAGRRRPAVDAGGGTGAGVRRGGGRQRRGRGASRRAGRHRAGGVGRDGVRRDPDRVRRLGHAAGTHRGGVPRVVRGRPPRGPGRRLGRRAGGARGRAPGPDGPRPVQPRRAAGRRRRTHRRPAGSAGRR